MECKAPQVFSTNVLLAAMDIPWIAAAVNAAARNRSAGFASLLPDLSAASNVWRIVRNVRASLLLHMLVTPGYVPVSRSMLEKVNIIAKPGRPLLRRDVSNQIFGTDGPRLVCGAVEFEESLGLANYGLVCLVINTDSISDSLSFLKRNCYHYVAKVELPAVALGVPTAVRALPRNLGMLVSLKLLESPESVCNEETLSSGRWKSLLLVSGAHRDLDDYIEAQFLWEPSQRVVDEVRVPSKSDIPRPSDEVDSASKAMAIDATVLEAWIAAQSASSSNPEYIAVRTIRVGNLSVQVLTPHSRTHGAPGRFPGALGGSMEVTSAP